MGKCNAIISKLSKNAREINIKRNIRIRWKNKKIENITNETAICKTRGFKDGMGK